MDPINPAFHGRLQKFHRLLLRRFRKFAGMQDTHMIDSKYTGIPVWMHMFTLLIFAREGHNIWPSTGIDCVLSTSIVISGIVDTQHLMSI
jgi:hypothetical protein